MLFSSMEREPCEPHDFQFLFHYVVAPNKGHIMLCCIVFIQFKKAALDFCHFACFSMFEFVGSLYHLQTDKSFLSNAECCLEMAMGTQNPMGFYPIRVRV